MAVTSINRIEHHREELRQKRLDQEREKANARKCGKYWQFYGGAGKNGMGRLEVRGMFKQCAWTEEEKNRFDLRNHEITIMIGPITLLGHKGEVLGKLGAQFGADDYFVGFWE